MIREQGGGEKRIGREWQRKGEREDNITGGGKADIR